MKLHAMWLAAVLAMSSGVALADTFTYQQGVAGYAGTSDTAVRAADPDFVHGSETELSIDASDGGLPSQALLRFDGVFGGGIGQIAPGALISSATLTLEITSAGSGIRFYDMLVPWNAATVTWHTAGDGIQTNGIEAAASPFLEIGVNDGSTNIPSGTLVLDVTDALRRIQSGAVPGFGWALMPFMPDGTNGVDFYSSEWVDAAFRPQLTVVAQPVPEPASWLLMLGAGSALAAVVRRRSSV
jgi:hypothetical protein